MSIYIERPVEGMYFGERNMRSSVKDHRARYEFASEVFTEGRSTDKHLLVGDMGCGGGESTEFLLMELQKRGFKNPEALGIDISVEAVFNARRRRLDGATFIAEDLGKEGLIERLRQLLPDFSTIDAIAFIEVLEHIHPPENAETSLRNLSSLLTADEGRLVVSSPNRRCTSGLRYRPYNPYHTQELEKCEFVTMLEDSGLSVISLNGQRHVPREYIERFDLLRQGANNWVVHSKVRGLVGKVIGLSILLKQPDAKVYPLCEDMEPKYFVAVCTKT